MLTTSGLAGTILVHKLAAAVADTGASIDEVEAIAKYTNSRLATIGVGLEHCHVSRSGTTHATLLSGFRAGAKPLGPRYAGGRVALGGDCLLYTSPSPRDGLLPRMPSSA